MILTKNIIILYNIFWPQIIMTYYIFLMKMQTQYYFYRRLRNYQSRCENGKSRWVKVYKYTIKLMAWSKTVWVTKNTNWDEEVYVFKKIGRFIEFNEKEKLTSNLTFNRMGKKTVDCTCTHACYMFQIHKNLSTKFK